MIVSNSYLRGEFGMRERGAVRGQLDCKLQKIMKKNCFVLQQNNTLIEFIFLDVFKVQHF